MARPWTQVKPLIEREIDDLKEQLTKAPPEAVLALQERIAALRSVRAWFEDTTQSEDRMISGDAPKY